MRTRPEDTSRASWSRRLSAALCLAMLAALAWGLHRYTFGFEVWTFEGRRERQLQAGELRAAPVALRRAPGVDLPLWREDAVEPRAYLVDFIYTRCPGVCRALGSEYQQMQQRLAQGQASEPALAGVRLVSVSIDLAHDDPATLARYASGLNADPRRWAFAVPATPDDSRALLGSLGVVVVRDGMGGFVHNGAIHLLDERGVLRGLYTLDEWPQALEAARRLVATGRAVAS